MGEKKGKGEWLKKVKNGVRKREKIRMREKEIERG